MNLQKAMFYIMKYCKMISKTSGEGFTPEPFNIALKSMEMQEKADLRMMVLLDEQLMELEKAREKGNKEECIYMDGVTDGIMQARRLLCKLYGCNNE